MVEDEEGSEEKVDWRMKLSKAVSEWNQDP